jgi:hypothetical protein
MYSTGTPEIFTPGGICAGGGGAVVVGAVVVTVVPVVVCRNPTGPFAASTAALNAPARAHVSRRKTARRPRLTRISVSASLAVSVEA